MTTPMNVSIRRPSREEASDLSALALRSKGHWGYDDAFLEACRAELTYSPEDCASGDMFVAEINGDQIGVGVVRGSEPVGELASLFVDPPWIGNGIGVALLNHAFVLARSRRMAHLMLDSDPQAELFYAHHGARKVGEVASGSIPGRRLPRMEVPVPRA